VVSGWVRDKRDDLVWWWRFANGKAATIAIGVFAVAAVAAILGVSFARLMRGLPI